MTQLGFSESVQIIDSRQTESARPIIGAEAVRDLLLSQVRPMINYGQDFDDPDNEIVAYLKSLDDDFIFVGPEEAGENTKKVVIENADAVRVRARRLLLLLHPDTSQLQREVFQIIEPRIKNSRERKLLLVEALTALEAGDHNALFPLEERIESFASQEQEQAEFARTVEKKMSEEEFEWCLSVLTHLERFFQSRFLARGKILESAEMTDDQVLEFITAQNIFDPLRKKAVLYRAQAYTDELLEAHQAILNKQSESFRNRVSLVGKRGKIRKEALRRLKHWHKDFEIDHEVHIDPLAQELVAGFQALREKINQAFGTTLLLGN